MSSCCADGAAIKRSLRAETMNGCVPGSSCGGGTCGTRKVVMDLLPANNASRWWGAAGFTT